MEILLMFNRQRTLEVFGYDIDPNKHSRRSDSDFDATGGIIKKHLTVVDNCPGCNKERRIQYRASKKNKLCCECFHNTPEMKATKLTQKGKQFTEEHKQHLKDNHWSKGGMKSPLKG
jgi:hypothetical protein